MYNLRKVKRKIDAVQGSHFFQIIFEFCVAKNFNKLTNLCRIEKFCREIRICTVALPAKRGNVH